MMGGEVPTHVFCYSLFYIYLYHYINFFCLGYTYNTWFTHLHVAGADLEGGGGGGGRTPSWNFENIFVRE